MHKGMNGYGPGASAPIDRLLRRTLVRSEQSSANSRQLSDCFLP